MKKEYYMEELVKRIENLFVMLPEEEMTASDLEWFMKGYKAALDRIIEEVREFFE